MLATLTPIDTICNCDAKPKRAGESYGNGARLPLGPTLHGGIRTTLLDQQGITGKKVRHYKKLKDKMIGSKAFNWLNIKGPLPILKMEKKVLFPTPLDLYVNETREVASLMWEAPEGQGTPNSLMLGKRKGKASKDTLPSWIDETALTAYINGELPKNLTQYKIFKEEYKMGVELDSENTAKEGKLYGVEHARLEENIELLAEISGTKQARPEELEQLQNANIIRLGGETRACYMTLTEGQFQIPTPKAEGHLIKWILLSPAIFLHGNLPGFVDDTGKVKINTGFRGLNRAISKPIAINGQLKGMAIGKPQTISLYDTVTCSAKAIYQAVPAGSVFLFESEEPDKLIQALHNRCLSSILGEKGLGWGICATIKKTI